MPAPDLHPYEPPSPNPVSPNPRSANPPSAEPPAHANGHYNGSGSHDRPSHYDNAVPTGEPNGRATATASAPSDLFTPFVPAQRTGEPAPAPAADAVADPVLAPPPVPAPTDFGFADSVMADLAFPEPFVVESYEASYAKTNGATVEAEPAGPDALDVDTEAMLPQRVPGVPDVPDVPLRPNDPLLDPNAISVADGAELSRIVTHLRDDTTEEPDERPDGFDLTAVLAAVRGVLGVRDANVRWNSGAGHTLRIEFVDGADEGLVTREVARLLRVTMGLAAAPNERLGAEENTLDRPRGRATVPSRPSAPPVQGSEPAPRGGHPMPPRRSSGGEPRVVLDHVKVTTVGVEASIDVRLVVSGGGSYDGRPAVGHGQGPAVDAYLLRLAATAAGDALDQLLIDPQAGTSQGRVFIEHVAVVPFGSVEVAVVVLLLVGGSFTEQLSGSAIVAGDPRQAVVRATLSAVNRRLQSLLS